MEDTDQRGLGIENESEWSNGTVHCDGTGPTEKSGPPGKVELFRSDLTDQFSFRPKFPEILVECIAPVDTNKDGFFPCVAEEYVTKLAFVINFFAIIRFALNFLGFEPISFGY